MRVNIEVVREMYEAFAKKDEKALRELLHPQVDWIQCAGFPGGGHRHGVEDVIEKVLGQLSEMWSEWRVDVDEYLDAGSSIVALGSYSGKNAETGHKMSAVFAHVYDLTDGQITRFRQYTDTHEIVSALQADPGDG